MKIDWEYKYVPDGQLEPDEHGRWAIYVNIWVNAKEALVQYEKAAEAFGRDGYVPVTVAIIEQKGCRGATVPSTIHQFSAGIPSFRDACNLGMAHKHYFFGNTIEEVQKQVQEEFDLIEKVFKNCL